MYSRRSLIIVTLVLLLQSPGIRAQILKDPGTFTCDKWTSTRASYRQDPLSDPFAQAITAWMQGYFAGADALGFGLAIHGVDGGARDRVRAGMAATASMLDAEAIPKWLDAYCSDPRDEAMATVALRLLRSAYKL